MICRPECRKLVSSQDIVRRPGRDHLGRCIEIAADLALQLKDIAQGVYIMPAFNRFDYVAEIIETLKQ